MPNVDWIDGSLFWYGWEGGKAVWRRVRSAGPRGVAVEGDAEAAGDREWAARTLGVTRACPSFGDPVLAGLARRYARLRPFAYGSLYEGLVVAIVGQSISLASAAVAQTRLSRAFYPGLEIGDRRYWPLPRPDDLADAPVALVRGSGVTTRRAEALVALGRAVVRGELPGDEHARRDPEEVYAVCRGLPLVGPWTAASALIWGVAAADAYPAGDAALLRAARASFGDRALTGSGMARAAEQWRPYRAWAARLLWTDLFEKPKRGERPLTGTTYPLENAMDQG